MKPALTTRIRGCIPLKSNKLPDAIVGILEKVMEKKIQTRQGLVTLAGYFIDDNTRCIHYNTEKDIIAIRFKCCNVYYPCYDCHKSLAGHQAIRWSAEEFNQLAVLCGVCRHLLTINEYLNCANQCPCCSSSFNPNCSKHYHLYFGS